MASPPASTGALSEPPLIVKPEVGRMLFPAFEDRCPPLDRPGSARRCPCSLPVGVLKRCKDAVRKVVEVECRRFGITNRHVHCEPGICGRAKTRPAGPFGLDRRAGVAIPLLRGTHEPPAAADETRRRANGGAADGRSSSGWTATQGGRCVSPERLGEGSGFVGERPGRSAGPKKLSSKKRERSWSRSSARKPGVRAPGATSSTQVVVELLQGYIVVLGPARRPRRRLWIERFGRPRPTILAVALAAPGTVKRRAI
jgi:hypothetical protein